MEAINDSTIREQLITLLCDRYNISLLFRNPDYWDIPLTSGEIGLDGFALAHLFFEIEKIYDKRFEANILKDYGVCTINNITKAILTI